jgi:hypothetical protein
MHAIAATRRIAVLVIIAALAALALLTSGVLHASGTSTASPRWNGVRSVVGKTVFAKSDSPRWN